MEGDQVLDELVGRKDVVAGEEEVNLLIKKKLEQKSEEDKILAGSSSGGVSGGVILISGRINIRGQVHGLDKTVTDDTEISQ